MTKRVAFGMGFDSAPVAELRQALTALAAEPAADRGPDNPALQIDVLGLRPWRGCWLGVVIAPWTADLVLLPGTGVHLAEEGMQVWQFPAGPVRFSAARLPVVGLCHRVRALDDVGSYASHEAAARAALAVLDGLLDPAATLAAAPAGSAPRPAAPVSRRDFLRGRFFRH